MESGNITEPLWNEGDHARKEPERTTPEQPVIIRYFAHFLSFIFHPLFIPSMVAAFVIFVHPYFFPGMTNKIHVYKWLFVFVNTAFLPAVTVLLLKLLGFAKSIHLPTQRERIIPYMASMIFFFNAFYVSRNQAENPRLFVVFLLGVFLASIAALMANIYFKVSMHAIAMGGLITIFLLMALQGTFSMSMYFSLAVLIAGLVCTSRLIVSDHSPFEVHAGFFLGILSQAVATFFV